MVLSRLGYFQICTMEIQKKRKKIPNFPTFIDEVFFVIRSAAQMSPKIEFGFNNNNLIANFLQARG